MIRAILAHDAHWGIGKLGGLPWKNTGDLAWFKESTAGSVVVMGRRTWESLPKRPLPNRENIVISSSIVEGVDISISGDPIDALDYVKDLFDNRDIWIIGGAQLLESCLPVIEELWFNDVGNDYDCDTFLPKKEITKLFEPSTVEIKPFGIVTVWKRRA